MKLASLAISVVAHTVLVGALWVASRSVEVPVPSEPDEPLIFELVEVDEAGGESATAAEACPQEEIGDSPLKSQKIVGEDMGDSPRDMAGDSPRFVEEIREECREIPDVQQVIAKNMGDCPRGFEQVVAKNNGDSPREFQEEHGDSPREFVADEMAPARLVAAPVALNRIQPHYPKSARRRNREGCVTVEFAVAADGKVESAAVVASSGYAELDASALDSVRKAQFAPATEDGEPVAATLRLTLEFRLK